MNYFDDKKVVVWGAKERGKVICDLIEKKYNKKIVCFVDRDDDLIGKDVCGIEVLSPDAFVDKYNDKSIVIILGGYNPNNKVEISAFLAKKNYQGEMIDCYEFHHRYELPVLLDRTVEINIDYENKISQWVKSFLAEASFWKDEAISSNGFYHDHYLNRIISNKEFECKRASAYIDSSSVVLDVGCGICSMYGNKINGKTFSLTGIDPLAPFYNRLNSKAYENGLTNGVKPSEIKFGLFEMMSYIYPNNSCDVILIDNAIDHCIDPLCSVVECLKTIKVGGVLSTYHHINEAYKAFYADMHQWNVCSNSENHLVFWNKESFIDVNKALGDYVDISTEVYESHGVAVPFGGVVCNMIKKKEIPDNFMDMARERNGIVIRLMMELLADPMYALDYLRFNLV